jgi:hypothetical protein
MSSYRPNTSGAGWRQREIEKAKARKEAEMKAREEAEKKQYAKTEQNFPSLIGAGGGSNTHVAFDHSFSTLASNWQRADDYELARAEMEREKARKARNEVSGVFIPRFRPGRLAEMEEEGYVEEEQPKVVPPKVDYEGWEEVKSKAKKQPRELSMAELAKKYENAASESDEEEKDVNSHLFDNRRRGELY